MSVQILSPFQYIHMMEYYSAIKRNKTQQMMNHRSILLSKSNETQKDTYYMTRHI